MDAEPANAEDGQKGSSGSPHLSADDQDLAAKHAAPRALVIHEIIRQDGEQEISRTSGALGLSGLAAGLSMGFSFLTEGLLRAGLPNNASRHTIESFGYGIGFMICILGRQQLFTENTLTAVLPFIAKRDGETLFNVARLWVIVLITNLVGTWIFAAIIHVPNVFAPDVTQALQSLAKDSVPPMFFATLVRAFFAGWLIALLVWVLPSAQSARLLTILIFTYVVALAHLSHIVAGSAEAAYDVLSGGTTLGGYFGSFLAPTLTGNILGGVVMVTVLNHGAIAPEMDGKGGTDSKQEG